MPRISLQEAQSRLESAGSQFSGRYVAGAQGKGSKWQAAASASSKNYQEGVTAALAKNKYATGVQAAGASAYDSGVAQKGSLNWSTGMSAGGSKYAKNVQKFVPLWDSALPVARGPRRSAANLQRMQANVDRFTKAAV